MFNYKYSKVFMAMMLPVLSANAAELEEVIVTGTPGGTGVSQLDAAFTITSLDNESINRFAPKGTADLLKTIPGVWSESSGGVSGANVFVRGLPSTGDADFVTVSLQGSPIFGASTLSFLEQTTLFRVDETIERVEGLRGGANTVFSNGQAGLTSNFILKEGGENPEGLVKLTIGDYNLTRVDAVHSGPLGSGWNYMIGGYVSRSDGIREADFTSEEGQQLTVNLTKEFEDGKIGIYNRYTDDHGQWYLPFPINSMGVDIGTFTQLTAENRFQTLDIHPTRPDGSTADFGEGRGWDGNIFGISFEKDFGSITLSNRFNYTSGDADTYGLVPAGAVTRAGDAPVVPGTGASIIGTPVSDGSVVAADDLLDAYGAWVVEKGLDAISNDLSLTTTLGDHELTAGFFYHDYSSDDVWSLGNTRVFVIGGGRVELDCVAQQNCGAFAIVQNGDAQRKAFYLHDKWQVNDKLALDFGVRKDDHEAEIDLATATFNATPPFNTTLPAPNNFAIEEDETSFTAGLNYNISDNTSAFIRLNEGYDFSQFDDIRGAQANLSSLVPSEVSQTEVGLKWQGDSAHVYLTLFESNLKGAPLITQTSTGPVNLGAAESEAKGIEIDADYAVGNFAVNLNATLQSTEQVNAGNPANIGNDAQRLPDTQFRLSPSYSFDIGSSSLIVYGGVTYVDDRFSDLANTQLLPSYTKLDLGAVLNQGDNWEYRIAVDNANDEEGFTQGNPQVFGSTTTARPILGRSVRASVQYNF